MLPLHNRIYDALGVPYNKVNDINKVNYVHSWAEAGFENGAPKFSMK